MQKVIVALDYPNLKSALKIIGLFKKPTWFKVGLELFVNEGVAAVKTLKKLKHFCFLDLKLHDIPNTVYHAVKNLAMIGADMIDVHALGGNKMLEAAAQALRDTKSSTKLIGITILTSLSDKELKEELSIAKTVDELSLKYASLCKANNLSGVVCSPYEAKQIKAKYDLLTICPGIRLKANSSDDQKRFCEPKVARELAADYLVVGRSITTAAKPYETYLKICKEFSGV